MKDGDPFEVDHKVERESKIDDNVICGIFGFRPKWIQRLANPKVFLVNYCIMGIFQGCFFPYTTAVMSTLEKRFAFDSRMSGLILIADTFSAIFVTFFIGYWGSHVHKPRWIANGTLIVTVGCLLSATPYFIYGPGLHLLDKIGLTGNNSTSYSLCNDQNLVEEHCEAGNVVTKIVVGLLFIAHLVYGLGCPPYYIIGTTYIDDGIRKKNSPLYLSMQLSLRLIGPSLGYVMASFCLSFYEDPFYDPEISKGDPRFIGAWWMGYLIIGFTLILTSLPMMLFPKGLPNSSSTNNSVASGKLPKLKEIPKSFQRLLANRIWLFQTLAAVFHVNAYGYYMIMPRYVEQHFKKNASDASLFSGTSTMLTMVAGILIGGLVIGKLRPRPRVLSGYMAGISVVSLLAMTSSIFLRCPQVTVAGTLYPDSRLLDLVNTCNQDCNCTTKVYQPLCGSDGVTNYFSPCFAGCLSRTSDNNQTIFNDCECVEEYQKTTDVISGLCPFECKYFLAYIMILGISQMISSTGRVGGALIVMRCVDPKEKDRALGTFSALVGVLAFIPYPLLFGAIADSACLVWEEKCGKTGNCWVYDTDKFRNYLHGTTFVFLFFGTVFDFMVCFYSKRLKNLYGDEDDCISKDEEIYLKKNSIEKVDSIMERNSIID